MTHVAITPTGARPEAWEMCCVNMAVQTRKPDVWIVVDDGPDPMPIPKISGLEIEVIRPTPLWEPGQVTLGRNLAVALERCHHIDRVAIIEDDDHYSRDWLETVFGWLDEADLVGESESLYLHRVTGRKHECRNTGHASLCSTAFTGQMIADALKIARTEQKFIDIRLWKIGFKKRCAKLFPPQPRRVIGIKGYPGRPGIGMGHRLGGRK